ncbi:MAG: hypothetical protein HGA94_03570, partial [Candidatus Aminicenantes bacterium]|nr:hypothetical protein [Candidatus Aminicenantes bacterium]
MTRRGRTVLLISVLAAVAACAAARKAPLAPATPGIDWAARISAADTLYAAGHYVALREAVGIYRDALAVPAWKAGVAEKLIRASLALELRKRELGDLPAEPFPA